VGKEGVEAVFLLRDLLIGEEKAVILEERRK